ncbi:MAG: hypothetical protein D6759_04880 [Chloroflexi bacterium]|nr:MAG: hypothetical protein D6759_04880 [Chloroflexota bacterium]
MHLPTHQPTTTSPHPSTPPATPLAAIIGAGGLGPPDDPLTAHTGVARKALIPLLGRPMVLYVAQALAESARVAHFIVVGLGPEEGLAFPLPVTYVPDRGTLLDNLLAGVAVLQRLSPGAERVLFAAADIPLITGEIVRETVDRSLASGADACYTIVPRPVMERRFPDARRSYVRLREGEFAGGDLHLFNPAILHRRPALLQALMGARKSALRQARIIGVGILIRYLFRRLSLPEGERRARQVLGGMPVRFLVSHHAELAMDVDKPHHLELVRAELARGTLPQLPSTARRLAVGRD